jgi:hypothetical protein
VLYQAIQKDITSLISNEGLINSLNQKIKVGYVTNINNPLDIVKGINYVLNYRNKKKLKNNISKFSKISDPKKWVLGFKEMHPKLFS